MRNSRLPLSTQWLAFPVMMVLLALLSGCATGPATLRTELTSYNDWAAVPADKTYTFTRTLRAKNSLEMNTYEALVRDELSKLGFSESADPAKARLAVTLRPSVRVENGLYGQNWRIGGGLYYDPFWRPVGFYGRRAFYGGAYFYPYPYFSPFYDLNRDTPVYQIKLQLDIDSLAANPGKRVYEGTVETEGWDDSLPKTMPYLVRALFSDFPGNNGEKRQVDVLMVK